MKLFKLKFIYFFVFSVMATATAGALGCKDELSKIATPPVDLIVDSNNRLKFVVRGGHSMATRAAGSFLTAAAAPFWLSGMSRVIQDSASSTKPVPVYEKMMEALNMDVQTQGTKIEEVPKDGPLLVVANHPLFGMEAMAIGSVLSKIRSDVKVVGNEMMKKFPGFEEVTIGVDMKGNKQKNAQAFRQMLSWLKDGNSLLIFPAGRVSQVQENGRYEDGRWSQSIPLLAEKTNAQILPIFVHERKPGLSFNLANKLFPPAAKSTYPLEILKQKGSTVHLTIGQPIPSQALDRLPTYQLYSDSLKTTTYQLKQ